VPFYRWSMTPLCGRFKRVVKEGINEAFRGEMKVVS
jgi:hypothetical protein